MVIGSIQPAFSVTVPGGELRTLLGNGGVARGVVMDTHAGQITARVAGQTVTFATHAPLPPGSAFLLSQEGGVWQMIPLPSSTAPASSQPAGSGMGPALIQAGLPAGGNSVLLTQALLAADLPATPAWVSGLTQVLGAVNPPDLPALAFMLQRGMPVSISSLAEVRRLMGIRDDLGNALSSLSQWGTALPAQGHTQVLELISSLDKFFLNLGGEPTLSGPQLAQMVTQAGAGLERALWAMTTPGMMDHLSQAILGDLRALLSKLAQALGEQPDLPEAEQGKQLTQRAQSLAESLQLANLPPRHPPAEGAWHYFQLPLQYQQERVTMELAYRQGKPSGKRDAPPQSELVLQVQMSDWGPVRAFLLTQDQLMTVVLTVKTEAIQSLLAEHAGELIKALEALGRQAPQLRLTVRDLSRERLQDLVMPALCLANQPSALDLRA